jgi:hypothetical protein
MARCDDKDTYLYKVSAVIISSSVMSITADFETGAPADARNRVEFPRIDKLLSYVILACGIWTVGIGATQIVTSHSLVPFWDEWTEIDAIATAPHHQLPLSWLWSQHNEHRIVFYRLLLLADIHVFHGKHWISFWSMLAVQLLSLASLAWMLHFCGVRGTLWRSIVGLGGFALFCPAQWENFRWAFQISFLLPGFLLLLALSAVLKYQRSVQQLRPQWGYLALSILAAAAATYSNANGILLWPLLLLLAIALVPRVEVIACYAGFGVMFIGLYFYHYASPPGPSSPLHSLRHPLWICEYIAEYLGITHILWGVRIRNSFAISSGLFGLLVALAVVVMVLWRQNREPLQFALLGVTFFATATAFLTALGRLNLGLEQAFSSRYQTFNLLFWFSTVSLLLLLVDRTNPLLRTLLLAAMGAAMLLAFATFPLALETSRTRTQRAEAAATALLSGVPDKDAMGVLYDEPIVVWRDADYFRQQHLFMFSDVKNDQLGQLLSSTYQSSPPLRCEGRVTTVQQLPPEELLGGSAAGAFGISGFATDRFSQAPVRRLVFVSDNKIVGYGASIGGFSAEKKNILFVLSGSSGVQQSEIVPKKDSDKWLGFSRQPRNAASIDVYALDSSVDTACRLATVEVPER